MFCSLFDEALAFKGPPAVFLPDPEGALRFDASWTRDAWGRAAGPHHLQPVWLLLRDRGTGFITLIYVTSNTLITEHPRLQIRVYETEAEAHAARRLFGSPPLAPQPW